jgi:Fic family protein
MAKDDGTDIGSRLTDLANRLSAINKEIEAREEEFEREMGELRRTRVDLAGELQSLTGALIGDMAPRPTAARARRARGERQSPQERADQVLEIVRAHPQGVNGKQIAEELGVSNATATKAINTLLESGQIRAEGERRARKLLPS